MRRAYVFLCLLAAACVPAVVTPGAPAPTPPVDLQRADTLDPRPPWDYEGLRAGALAAIAPLMGYYGRERPPAGTIQELRVLAWHVQQDTAQELRIERALLWLQLSGEPPLWALANLYRHPLTDTTWRPATATHVQYYGGRLFPQRPGNADVYALLDIAQNWPFEEDPAAPFVEADVRERTWRSVVGEAPARFYVRAEPEAPPDEPEDPAEPEVPDEDGDPDEQEGDVPR